MSLYLRSDILKIDIDIPYNVFLNEFYNEWKKLLECAKKMYDFDIKFLDIVKSKSGNIHINIVMSKKFDYKTILKIEFFLGDDRKRIYFKNERLKASGDPYDFFF